MGVYDTATKLASEIKNSREYKEFKKNMTEVKKDKKLEELLKEYKVTQIEIQSCLMQNKSLDKKSKIKINIIQDEIGKNKKLQQYLICESKFTCMMDNINKILAQTIEKDYR
ncbi:YlbF family regulator [Romboutsia sp.]|uniref:YlbF family regulator n=1 Tax=Romboutsia sp. TaxID=1965302 RepID=UPI003F3802F5